MTPEEFRKQFPYIETVRFWSKNRWVTLDGVFTAEELRAVIAVLEHQALRPCRNQHCECEHDKCTHPGFYDARGK